MYGMLVQWAIFTKEILCVFRNIVWIGRWSAYIGNMRNVHIGCILGANK
jgi:hypothetical protein